MNRVESIQTPSNYPAHYPPMDTRSPVARPHARARNGWAVLAQLVGPQPVPPEAKPPVAVSVKEVSPSVPTPSVWQKLGRFATGLFSGREAARSSHPEAAPRMIRPREWALAAGNLAVALPELAVAVGRQAGAAALDSLHNLTDFAGYARQLQLISMYDRSGEGLVNTDSRFKLWGAVKKWATQADAKDEAKLEKSSYAWISLPAIGAIGLAGYGLARELTSHSEKTGIDFADAAHLGATGAALALAGGLVHAGARMRRKVDKMKHSPQNLVRHVRSFYSHAKLDAASSLAATIEAVAHMLGHGTAAINMGVMAIAGYQAWRFWPSRVARRTQQDRHHASTSHHGHSHDAHTPHAGHEGNDHDHCNHVHIVPHEMTEAISAMWHKVRAVGGIALAGVANVREQPGTVLEKGQSWLQARQQTKQARQQHDAKRPWWTWVEGLAAGPEGPMQSWAFEQRNRPEGIAWRRVEQERLAARRPRRLRAAIAAGLTAVALGAGLSADTAQSEVSAQPHAPVVVTETPPDVSSPPKVGTQTETSPVQFTECLDVRPGDSLWSKAENSIREATGEEASTSATYAITILAAHENQETNPNPNLIHPDQCVEMLTPASVERVHGALTDPTQANTKLAAGLRSLIDQTTLQDALGQAETIYEIRAELAEVAR